MEADEAKPVAVLAAEKCVYNLTYSRRVGVRLEWIVGVHCVHAARQLVDVRLNDFAVVHRDWGVGDDFVVHGWFGLRWLKDCALASRTPRWVRVIFYVLFLIPIDLPYLKQRIFYLTHRLVLRFWHLRANTNTLLIRCLPIAQGKLL